MYINIAGLGYIVAHRCGGFLVAVGVDGGQQVDACLVHEPPDACVSAQILLTHELHEQQQQLAAQNLVTMGTSRVAELRLTCEHTHTHYHITHNTHTIIQNTLSHNIHTSHTHHHATYKHTHTNITHTTHTHTIKQHTQSHTNTPNSSEQLNDVTETTMNSLFSSTLDTVAPLRLRKIKEKSPTPWYNEHIRTLKRADWKMEHSWRKTKLEVFHIAWRESTLSYRKTEKIAISDYFTSLLEENKHKSIYSIHCAKLTKFNISRCSGARNLSLSLGYVPKNL